MKKLTIAVALLGLTLTSVTAKPSIESTITPEFNVNDKVTLISSGESGVILESYCFANTGSSMGCTYKVYVKLPDLHQKQNNHLVLTGIMGFELYPEKSKKI